MGVAESGESELIRVSVVDYFSCEVLLDSLVWPNVSMGYYNTRFSGVSRHAMENARRTRSCIFGRDNARKAVCTFVGPDTVVVGHAAQNDLISLRWIHPSVVDTLVIELGNRFQESKAENNDNGRGTGSEQPKVGIKSGGLSLKALALHRLNRRIQMKGKGHDSLEDAVATRDLLHWHIAKDLWPNGTED
jgi:RNA exonuclease 1